MRETWREAPERGEHIMAGPAVKPGTDSAGTASIGELVSVAVKDVSRLLRFEIELAKLELKSDVRRLGIAGALLGIAAFVGCLVLVLLCFAFAYGLIAVGIWAWASFLIVAGTCVVLAALAVVIGFMKVRKLSGLKQTRRTVQDDLALLKREDSGAAAASGPR
jgi:uncharacterized membrane protein YqjE